jgi:hypothetical protein
LPAVLREGLADLALAHCLQPATHYLLRATSRDAGGVLRAVSNDAGFDTPAAPAWSRAHTSR